MFGRAKNNEQQSSDGEARQPLLNSSHDDLPTSETVFAVDDNDDDDEEESALPGAPVVPPHRVRFQEEVQYAPPLRSTMQSREDQYELDPDELDDDSLRQLETDERSPRVDRHRDQRMPLLVGLIDTAAVRRSMDGTLTLSNLGGEANGGVEDVDLEELAAKRTAGGGMLDSIANMANSILGAGIIGLPYALSQAGFWMGLFLLVTLCGLTDWTIRLIAVNAKLSGRTSYIDIMDHCFGSSGRAAVSFFQFAFAFGGMCAFGIIIGDTIPQVLRHAFPSLHRVPVLSLLTNRQFVIAFCTICVSYPLSLYRDIHKLSRASGLALVGMLIVVSSVLIEGPQAPPELRGDPAKRYSIVGPGVFQAVGVISFAFVCHHNSLLIYGSLRTPTLDRFATVTHISTAISLVACCTLAVSAYWVFTDKTQGNILNNFSTSDTFINIARFCFGLNMFTTLPLELFVCREVIEQYFFSHEPFSPHRHLMFTTAIIIAAMFLSLITCDLGVMLEITGGVSATAFAFIFPAACYLKLAHHGEPWHSRGRLPAVACVGFGICVLMVSLALALGKTWSPEGNAKICV